MGCGLTWVDRELHKAFYKLGLLVGKRPGYFLIVPVLLAALCITGFQRIKYQIDPEYLFSPVYGNGKAERAVVEEFFMPNYTSRFHVGRITRPGRFGRVIIIPRHGGDMLHREIWDELRLLDQIIQNATVHGEDDEYYTYKDVCAKWVDECFHNDILNLDYVIDDVENGLLNLTFPIMFNPVTWEAHTFPVFFGGTVVDDDGIILSVPSLQLVYFVTADNKRQDARGAAWEEAFLAAVEHAEAHVLKHISTARFASRTLDIELERNTRTVIPYFSVTFIIMALFSIASCMMTDWVRAKPWLGLMGNVSAAMATAAAFGVVIYLGVEFIGINLAAPFLMLGIGIDDTFVMLAAWRRTPVTLSVPERMGKMMSEAAVSITITSFTDMISFWIGIISPFQSVRIFCIYSGFAVWFTFMWHITFFAGCMAVAGYMEKRNLHSLVGVKVKPVSEAAKSPFLYRMFCTGGINPNDPHNPIDNKEHGIMVFFRDRVAKVLNKWQAKVIVVMVFGVYLAGALYGITTLKEGLERRKLSRSDSYSVEFYDREDIYFREFPYRIQIILSGQMNYSDPKVQEEVENLTQTFENTSFISSPLYTESWLRSFVGYVTRNQEYLNVTIDTEDTFIENLKELWLFSPNPFSLDVKFNDDGTRIIASRILIQAVNITDSNHEKEMVRALRKICDESHLNVTVFHPYFVFFDQFELVRPTSIQSMIIGALVMMIVCFIFIPNVLCCLWVAFSIISIETGVAGYMALWDVHLDSISMINLIMCIGFSVDFTAHICYAYMSSKATRPEDRVRECLYALGLPIIQGASSTILAVVSLIFAESYIFLVFFKMVFLVVFFGAMHGLFLLPVLLSLFGPGSCTKPDKERKREMEEGKVSAVEKALPHPFCIPHPSLHTTSLQNGFPFRNPSGDAKTSSPYLQNGSPAFGKARGPPAFGIPLPGLPTHMTVYNGRGGSLTTLDKDLGIGTSGEDSSESSSSKSQRRMKLEEEQRRRYEEGWRKSSNDSSESNCHHPREFQPPHLMEVYNNAGYVSDEDRGRAWRRSKYSPEQERRGRARSKSQHRSTPGYIGEIRFP